MQRTFVQARLICAAGLVLLIGFVAGAAHAAKPVEELAQYLTNVSAYGFSGQVLVMENGKIILSRGYGFADQNTRTANSRGTVFNIASLSKQFTAAAILRLEADGKLKTSDKISKFFDGVPDDKAGITIDQLLTHSSGLPRGDDGVGSSTRAEVIANVFSRPLAEVPGQKFHYSNLGYRLLAAIVESASGMSFPDYVRERLFRSAGLDHTGFYQEPRWKKSEIASPYNEWSRLKSFTEWDKGWNYGPFVTG
jgi:CubicO group peptidase (beta-lactamase class C family)